MRMDWTVATGMILAVGFGAVGAAPAAAQASYIPVFASPDRVYFVDASSEKGMPPAVSIRVFVAIDPPMARGISAREYTASVDCTANTFTIAGLVSLDGDLNQVSADPEPTKPAAVGGPFTGIRRYVCEGEIPAGASRYGSRAEARAAGLQIIAANRPSPSGQ
jgi:hypothetical protein